MSERKRVLTKEELDDLITSEAKSIGARMVEKLSPQVSLNAELTLLLAQKVADESLDYIRKQFGLPLESDGSEEEL